jgi:hypothetical protein
MLTLATTARKLKITVVIDVAPFTQLGVPPDNAPPRTSLMVAIGDRTLSVDLATKSVRRAVRTMLEHGEQNVALVLQGALAADDLVEEAGLVARGEGAADRGVTREAAKRTKRRARAPSSCGRGVIPKGDEPSAAGRARRPVSRRRATLPHAIPWPARIGGRAGSRLNVNRRVV